MINSVTETRNVTGNCVLTSKVPFETAENSGVHKCDQRLESTQKRFLQSLPGVTKPDHELKIQTSEEGKKNMSNIIR
jgi:hypothetical protein